MGYVIVEFARPREVLVNGVSQGANMDQAGHYRILRVEDGVQTFSLAGPEDYRPLRQTVVVGGTSLIEPLRVTFQRKA
jgi:hypothetical protein